MENPERMNFIAEFAAAGKLKPVIDRSYPLEQIAEAFKYVEQGWINHPDRAMIACLNVHRAMIA